MALEILMITHDTNEQRNGSRDTCERTRDGIQPSENTAFSIHHQNSSSVSPFQANTGVPASATAAATSFYNINHYFYYPGYNIFTAQR